MPPASTTVEVAVMPCSVTTPAHPAPLEIEAPDRTSGDDASAKAFRCLGQCGDRKARFRAAVRRRVEGRSERPFHVGNKRLQFRCRQQP